MGRKKRRDRKTVRSEPPESAGTQRGFLRRWSERKAQVEKLPASSAPVVKESAPPAQVGEPSPPLTDADMPAIDALDEKSDYKGFFSPKVSEDLRRLALRKLFHLPAFNIRDGLDDYDEDYRTFEALGNIVTAHERHQSEMQQQDDKERLAPEKREAERTPLAENDSTVVEDSKKSEQIADETTSAESEDTQDPDDDGEHVRHG